MDNACNIGWATCKCNKESMLRTVSMNNFWPEKWHGDEDVHLSKGQIILPVFDSLLRRSAVVFLLSSVWLSCLQGGPPAYRSEMPSR
jgi:hypothetical protein